MSLPPDCIKLEKHTFAFWRDYGLHLFALICGSISGGLFLKEALMVKKKNKRTIMLSGLGVLVGFTYYYTSFDKFTSDGFDHDKYVKTTIVNYKTDEYVKE